MWQFDLNCCPSNKLAEIAAFRNRRRRGGSYEGRQSNFNLRQIGRIRIAISGRRRHALAGAVSPEYGSKSFTRTGKRKKRQCYSKPSPGRSSLNTFMGESSGLS